MKRIRTINSHAGLARYLARCADEPVGYIPRQADIPSPYRYSPEWTVERHESDGLVVWVETRHRRYEVFAVPAELVQIAAPEEVA